MSSERSMIRSMAVLLIGNSSLQQYFLFALPQRRAVRFQNDLCRSVAGFDPGLIGAEQPRPFALSGRRRDVDLVRPFHPIGVEAHSRSLASADDHDIPVAET